MSFALLNRFLRAPADVAKECKNEQNVSSIAAASLLAITVGAVLFGATVGSWRGGWQIAFAAAKLPLVSAGTLALCVPAFYAIAQVFGRPWPLRAIVSMMLVAGARLSLVLLAATPVLWLAISLGAPYELVKLLAALAYALAGLAALVLLIRGIGAGRGRAAILVTFISVFLLTGGQAAWVLRPYLGTPDKSDIVLFTREREGGLAYQLCVAFGDLVRGATHRSHP
jgi:hypothetical protein